MTLPDQYTEEQAKEMIREQYRKETGEELPDHVVENYETMFQLGPTTEDIQNLLENEKQRRDELRDRLYSRAEVGGALSIIAVLASILGFVAGAVWIALSYEFADVGVAFVALVFTAFGFVLGSLLS